MEENKSTAVCFNCLQESGQKYEEKFCSNSYVCRYDLKCLWIANEDVEYVHVFKRSFDGKVLSEREILILFKLILQCYLKLQQDATASVITKQHEDSVYFQARDDICNSLQTIRNNVDNLSCDTTVIHDCVSNGIKFVLKKVQGFKYFNETFINKCLTHKFGNRIHSACYNYFHVQLDIRYMLLTIIYKLHRSSIDSNPIVESFLEAIILDLIKFSSITFNSMSKDSKQFTRTPFPCKCFEELWLLIQLFLEKEFSRCSQNFWTYFNKQLSNHCKSFGNNSSTQAAFCIWLTCNVAKIQNYDEWGKHIAGRSDRVVANVSVLVDAFKKLSTDRSADEVLYKSLVLSAPYLSKFWISDTGLEIYQQLWEFFWKNINADLLHQYPKSVKEIVDFVTEISCNPSSANAATSYELFLKLLCHHFKHHSDPSLWNRLKGRIYSRLAPNTINEMNDRQIFNLLFLLLCVNNVFASESDICEEMISILSEISAGKQQSPLMLHIYAAFVIMSTNGGFAASENLHKLVQSVLNIVMIVSSDRSNGKLMRSFVEGIHECVSDQDYEHLFMGHWINYYTTWCSKNDLAYFLDVVLKLCHKKWGLGAKHWEEHCKEFILPCLKTVAVSDANATYQVGKIAAIILVEHPEALAEYFPFFAGDRSSPKMMHQFLLELLNDSKFRFGNSSASAAAADDEELQYKVVQAWLKGCMFFSDDRMSAVNRTVVRLPVMQIARESLQECLERDTSSDSFVAFCKALEAELQATPEKLVALRSWCENIFGFLPVWLSMCVKSCEFHDVDLSRIYKCCAHLFYRCPSILYARAKTNCVMTVLTGTLLLPTEVLTGKKPRPDVLEAIKATLHLYIRGVAKLNYQQDPHLERTLRDLIIKYVPHCNDHSSPLLKCLDQALGPLVLDKLASLIRQLKNEPAQLENALRFVRQIVSDRNANVERLRLVVLKLMPVLLELLLFMQQPDAPNKQKIVGILDNVALATEFHKVKNDATNCLIRFTEQHLAFNSRLYFPLVCTLLAKLMPMEMNMTLPFLRSHISNVEKLRGVGYDNNLRTGLKKVEQAVVMFLKH